MGITAERLRNNALAALIKVGMPDEDAQLVMDEVMYAQLGGKDHQGLSGLAVTVEGLRVGIINAKPKMRVITETPATALIDGDRGTGQVVGIRGMQIAIDKASRNGIAVVNVRNCQSLYAVGYYAKYAAEKGMIGLVMQNAGSWVAPTGSMEPVHGTNPIAIGIPTRADPIVIDMSTSQMSHGRVELAILRGEKVPPGCGIDGKGNPTQDPALITCRANFPAIETGAMLPLGGAKGYCLSFAVDVLAGALSGAAVGKEVISNPAQSEYTKTCNHGGLFIAINPELMCGRDTFLDAVDRLSKQVKNAKKIPGQTVYLPGEQALLRRSKKLQQGIELDEDTDPAWNKILELLG